MHGYADLQQRYDDAVKKIGSNYADVLKLKKPTTIGDRVARVHHVVSVINECTSEIASLALCGVCASYDVAEALHNEWRQMTIKYFETVLPQGMNKAKEFPQIEDTILAAADLRRVCAEAGVTFQNLEAHPHLAIPGTSIREATSRIAATAGVWAALRPGLVKVVLDTLQWERSVEEFTDLATDPTILKRRKLAREALDLYSRLTLQADREKAFGLIIDDYYGRLTSEVKARTKSWSVKRILDEGSLLMRRELDRCEVVMAPFGKDVVSRCKLTLQKAMLGANSERIAMDKEWGAAAALQYPLTRAGEFSNLVLLLDFDPQAVTNIEGAVESCVAATIAARIAREGGNPLRCLKDLVTITGEYTRAVTVDRATAQHSLSFCVAVQAGVMSGLPIDGSVEEGFVSLIDEVLKEKRPPAGTPDTRGARVGELMAGFNLLRDAELFVAQYKRQLAARLLLRPHVSLTLERTTVDAIERQLGTASVRHLRVMLEAAVSFVASSGEGAADATPWVNALIWPGAPAATRQMKLVAPLQTAFDAALATKTSGASSSGGGRLRHHIDPHLSRCEVAFRPPNSDHACQIMCCATQANLLARLTPTPSKFDDLVSAMAVPAEELRLVLESVRRSGIVVIDDAAGTVAANAQFMEGATAKRKIVLPTLIVIKRAITAAVHADPTSELAVDPAPMGTEAAPAGSGGNGGGKLARAKGALAYVVGKTLGK